MSKLYLLFFLCLMAMGCYSNDPRLPERLYLEALELSNEGKILESKTLMEEVARRFPEKREGMAAATDIIRLEAMLRHKADEEKKQVSQIIRSTCDALRRYRDRNGEYPSSLQKLVPDYGLDQIPMTPWKHPLLYRPFVSVPRERVIDRRGRATERANSKFDAYHLACLGTDLAPSPQGEGTEILVVNGVIIEGNRFPPIPQPQPFRL
ncbi:MAG: type II secretion system protein GspG [Holophagaceae bacterium]|nr:type II secretion system protein GspG [Holophagaceae bacterium]